jgi:hypothetical protein
LRLGRAISKRRQYFKYCEKHHKKLAQDLISPRNVLTVLTSTSPMIETQDTFDVDNKGAERYIEMPAHLPKLEVEHSVDMTTALTETTASQFVRGDNDFEIESDSGQTSTSYATTEPFAGKLAIPPHPKESVQGRPFECPYCYTIVSTKNSNAWKKHIFRDLQPYLCTFETCSKAGKMFHSRHDWWDHELLDHRKEWFCTADCQQTFKSQTTFEKHVRDTHSITSGHQIGALIDMCHRPVDEVTEEQCPLCFETLSSTKQLCRHLARHLEDLALFALPRDKDDEGEDDLDSDKPQPSNKSIEVSGSSLSSNNSTKSDVSSGYFEDHASGKDESNDPEKGSSSNIMLDYADAEDTFDLLDDLNSAQTERLDKQFLPMLDRRVIDALIGANSYLEGRDSEFRRLFTNVAQLLTRETFQSLAQSNAQINDIVLEIYLQAREELPKERKYRHGNHMGRCPRRSPSAFCQNNPRHLRGRR